MSNELHVNAATGKTVWFDRLNAAGQVALTDGSAFEDWGASGHDADDYDVAGPEVGSGGHYVGSFDASGNIAGPKKYYYRAHDQAGANPVDSDPVIDPGGQGEICWSGTGEITAEKLLADKAVQTKSTGAIEYYDEDGSTVLLTQTPTDAAATITRTPS